MRPAVLLIDPREERRRALAQGLAALGYEVVPAVSAAEGQRFAQGLGPSVVVGAEEVEGVGDGSLLARFSVLDPARMRRTLVVLAESAADAAGEAAADLPDDLRLLPVGGLDHEEILRRIQLVLIGREVGLDPDLELRYLVGDTALLPVVDLARELQRCRVTGKVSLTFGWLLFDAGVLTGAKAGKAEGAKAFGRLVRRGGGPFRIFLETPIESPNIDQSWERLTLLALEEKNLELPDLRTKVRHAAAQLGPGELSPHERVLLQTIDRCDTLGDVFDALPVPDSLVLQAVAKMVARGALRLERPKHQVKVITDSTADLPPDLARGHDILVVPLTIRFGEESFRDGLDITAREFYQKLQQDPRHPSTRPPSEEDFYGHFHRLIVEQDLLAVHISGKLSLTAEHAQKAAMRGIRSFDHLPKDRHNCALEVVDSRSVSLGLGLLALFAARMAARGEKVFAISHRLRQMATRLHILFAVDTLDYLQRGGRIGKAQAWVGKLLAIKPILGVVGGEVVPVDKVRGGRRVHPRIVELVRERIDPKLPIVACVAHAQAPVWCDRLRKLLEQSFEVREMLQGDIGPVVGTHAGPGAVGTVFFQPSEEEWPLIAPLQGAAG